MSVWTCGFTAFSRKQKAVSAKDKKIIQERIANLALDWDAGKGFENVRDLKYNNFETFEWLYEKYTHKPLDPSEFPTNFKDIRKLEAGLRYYNSKLAKPRGYFASKFHLPREAMKNFPELKRFEMKLIDQTSFFRSYTNETNGPVNDILHTFKKFTTTFGNAKFKTFRNLAGQGQKRGINSSRAV